MKPLPKTETRQGPQPACSEGLADWVLDVHLIPDDAYRTIFDQAATGIAILDLDGRFLKVNAECCRILGYGDRELPGLNIRAISPGDDLDTDQRVFAELLAGRIAQYRREKQAVRGDGTLVWIQLDVSLIRSADGEPGYFACQVRDNTERKRVEHALHQSEERFRTLATYAPFGVFETSPDGRSMLIDRTGARWCICVANFGRCSEICMPGTDVSTGLNGPPLACPGFRSKVSIWLGPPDIHSKIQARRRSERMAASSANAFIQPDAE